MSKRESSIQSAVVQAILARWPDAWVRVKHGTQFGKAGDPDVYGCVDGCFIGLEVKNEDGDLSAIQEHCLQRLEEAGAICGGVRSPDDAVNLIHLLLLRR